VVKPVTKYIQNGDVSIAYQVFGSGPRDVVFVHGFVSNVELVWEEPTFSRFFERLATYCRVIHFDKRGTGLSDRVVDMPNLETRMDDVRAVMDAVGSTSAVLCGVSEGAAMCVLFAATYPERAAALIIAAGFARRTRAPDYPYGPTAMEWERLALDMSRQWGTTVRLATLVPSLADDAQFAEWWGRWLRLGASPAANLAVMRLSGQVDVRHVLPAIRVPTLVIHNAGDQNIPVEMGRYMAERIPGAKYVELPGIDHVVFGANSDAILEEIEEFITGARSGPEPDRVLATVLFTDIVGATRKASELGDRRWHTLIESHHALVRRQLARFRGREIDTAGDGFLATFDGPARAIHCARAIADSVRSLGVQIRAGLHTGECEVIGSKLGGIAVHIGARVAALAEADEVLVSSTVRELVAGSGLHFRDRGVHALRGVPGEWRLFAVQRGDGSP
jgi:pimeloyl-ACP methyl ester carboxylesterase